MSNEERDVFDKATLAREKEEQAGKRVSAPMSLGRLRADGSALPYRWSQELETVSVTVRLPPGMRARDLQVVMQKRKLMAGRPIPVGCPC